MDHNTPKSNTFRRPSMVFVDVPPSPYSIVSHRAPGPSARPTNTPAKSRTNVYVDIPPSPLHTNPILRPPMSQSTRVLAIDNTRKRPLGELDQGNSSPSKKAKADEPMKPIRCHQCQKPREALGESVFSPLELSL
jgi:hypothetical protein